MDERYDEEIRISVRRYAYNSNGPTREVIIKDYTFSAATFDEALDPKELLMYTISGMRKMLEHEDMRRLHPSPKVDVED